MIVTGAPQFVALWNTVVKESEASKANWVSALRKSGFKAAHPNDGWVDRQNNKLKLVYPHFDDGVEVGSLVMLGWHFDAPSKHRPVRLIARRDTLFSYGYWEFEDITLDGGA